MWPLEVPSNHMRGSGASSSESSAHCSLRDAELLCVSALLWPLGDSWTPADHMMELKTRPEWGSTSAHAHSFGALPVTPDNHTTTQIR